MKKHIYILAALFCCLWSFGQNFTAGGINYAVTNATAPQTVQVATHSSFTGAANIPSSVTNAGTSYSVTSIATNGFRNCGGLTSVSIPSSVISIGEEAFKGCNGLTSVSMPSSIIIIGCCTFSGCSSLTSLNLPTSLSSIGDSMFSACSSLTSLSIPSSVTSIGLQAFFGCTGLTSVSIPSSVTSIGNRTFAGCTSLTSVSIPSSVTSIGNGAFSTCTGLTSVTVNWATPLTINANVFQGITLSNVALNVPAGSAALYDAAAVWTDFNLTAALSNSSFNKIADINLYPNPSNGIFNFQLTNDLQIEVYNNLGQLMQSEKMISGNNTINIMDKEAGIYYLKANNGNNTSTYKMIKN